VTAPTDDTCAVVFSSDGVIRYVRWSNQLSLPVRQEGRSVAERLRQFKRAFGAASSSGALADLDGAVWLETKWGKAPPRILEQSVRPANRVQTTCCFLNRAKPMVTKTSNSRTVGRHDFANDSPGSRCLLTVRLFLFAWRLERRSLASADGRNDHDGGHQEEDDDHHENDDRQRRPVSAALREESGRI
jgi:hypothetical protein